MNWWMTVLSHRNLSYTVYKQNDDQEIVLFSEPLDWSSQSSLIPSIVGYAYIAGSELYSIWAKHGYGPTLYRIAFHEGKGLTCGGEGCTPEAENVFREFYEGKGAADVTREENYSNEYQEPHLRARYFNARPLDAKKVSISNIDHSNLLLETATYVANYHLLRIYDPMSWASEYDQEPGSL